MSLEINNRALAFQKTSAILLISSDMHQSVFAVLKQGFPHDLKEYVLVCTCMRACSVCYNASACCEVHVCVCPRAGRCVARG